MSRIIREIRPQAGPQTAFLSTSADIAIYGGGAGSGKSYGLLLDAIRHVRNPRYGAVCFRRLSPQITQEGGLWDTAGELYPLIGGIPKVGDLQYAWRRGGRVTFHHLQHEGTKYHWQGGQIPWLGFDELTHYSESQFFYLMSRSRSTCGVRPVVRGTTNPDASSWVKRFLAPWVDRKHPLYPTPSGTVLWIVRHKGVIQYRQTPEEIAREFPGLLPKSLTFIRANIYDNPALLAANPEYLADLMMQTLVEQERLLHGNWDIVNEGLVYPEFGMRVIEPEDWPDEIAGRKVGGIDWGFRDPFAAVLATEDVQGNLWVEWEHSESRMSLTAISKVLPRFEGNEPRWWCDPAGPTQAAEVRMAGHDIISCVHKGPKPIKAGVAVVTDRLRADPPSLFIRGDLGCLIDEAGKYRYPEAGKGDSEQPVDADNHLMDALRYLIVGNDRRSVVQDQAPPESDESKEARAKAEAEEREKAEAEYYDQDNDRWWSR